MDAQKTMRIKPIIKKYAAIFTLAATLAGCTGGLEKTVREANTKSTYVTTAYQVEIRPYYDQDPIFMAGIEVIRKAYGNGLDVKDIEESIKYTKGSPEYNALRPLLTVEKTRQVY